MLVASGLDALVHVRTPSNRLRTGAQFTGRSVALARELGVAFSMDEAKAVWAHRSDISHGRDLWEALRNAGGMPPVLTKDQPLVQRYIACEQILRSTVLKCLTERAFASKFQSDLSVESAYQV